MTTFAELAHLARGIWSQYGPKSGEKLTDRHCIALEKARGRALKKVGARPGQSRWFEVEFDRIIWTSELGKPSNTGGIHASCWEDAILHRAMWPETHQARVIDVRRIYFAGEPTVWDDVFAELDKEKP